MTNPDADPVLAARFAEPMRELDDDRGALRSLLAQLERADRRRVGVLTTAGVAGALLAVAIIAATNAISASLAGLSLLSMRVMTALAQMRPEWSVTSWAGTVPEGAIAIALGVLVLGAAAGVVLRTRS